MGTEKKTTNDERLSQALQAGHSDSVIEIDASRVASLIPLKDEPPASWRKHADLETSFCRAFAEVEGLRSAGAKVESLGGKEGSKKSRIAAITVDVPFDVSEVQVKGKQDFIDQKIASAGREMGMESAKKIESLFISGTGENQPLGFLSDSGNLPIMGFEEAEHKMSHHDTISWMMYEPTYWDATPYSEPTIYHAPHHLTLLEHDVSFNNQLDPTVVVVGAFHKGYTITEYTKAELEVKTPYPSPANPNRVLLQLTLHIDGRVSDPDALLAFKLPHA